jgi:hypothetical protein
MLFIFDNVRENRYFCDRITGIGHEISCPACPVADFGKRAVCFRNRNGYVIPCKEVYFK